MADNGITCPQSRAGNVWDSAAMANCFSSLKTKRTAHKVYCTRVRDEGHRRRGLLVDIRREWLLSDHQWRRNRGGLYLRLSLLATVGAGPWLIDAKRGKA